MSHLLRWGNYLTTALTGTLIYVICSLKNIKKEKMKMKKKRKQVYPILLWKLPDGSAALLPHFLPGRRAGIWM